MGDSQKGLAPAFLIIAFALIVVLFVGVLAYTYISDKSKQPNQAAVASPTAEATTTAVAVPGMSKYTDAGFGFSFWYPTEWKVTKVSVQDPYRYAGGTVTKQFIVTNGSTTLTIEEFYSPNKTITITPCDASSRQCSESARYYFDAVTNNTWMVEKRVGNAPAIIRLADASLKTMGGLYTFAGNGLFGAATIIPLSDQNFLILSSNQESGVVPGEENYLGNTIVSTDPSVGTPVSLAEQMQIIQAAATAYGVSPQGTITNTPSALSPVSYVQQTQTTQIDTTPYIAPPEDTTASVVIPSSQTLATSTSSVPETFTFPSDPLNQGGDFFARYGFCCISTILDVVPAQDERIIPASFLLLP
ncbi:MAG: hypothetical protein Q7S75_03795 [bacterium]|nr:hypothetical protein [bacterium]